LNIEFIFYIVLTGNATVSGLLSVICFQTSYLTKQAGFKNIGYGWAFNLLYLGLNFKVSYVNGYQSWVFEFVPSQYILVVNLFFAFINAIGNIFFILGCESEVNGLKWIGKNKLAIAMWFFMLAIIESSPFENRIFTSLLSIIIIGSGLFVVYILLIYFRSLKYVRPLKGLLISYSPLLLGTQLFALLQLTGLLIKPINEGLFVPSSIYGLSFLFKIGILHGIFHMLVVWIKDKTSELQIRTSELQKAKDENVKKEQLAKEFDSINKHFLHEIKPPVRIIREEFNKYKIDQDRRRLLEKVEPQFLAIEAIADSSSDLRILFSEYSSKNLFRNDKKLMNQNVDGQKSHGNINTAIQFAISSFKSFSAAEYEEQNYIIRPDYGADCDLMANLNELERLFVILLKNSIEAMDFSQGKLQIKIMSRIKNSVIHVEYEDNAGGVKSNLVKLIWDDGFSTKGSNRGHGMAIARKIVENHHGEILFHTTEGFNGKGVRFEISLPVD
jgi:signal transduction histidine kinase